MKSTTIDRDSPEWHVAWNGLAAAAGDIVAENEGEVWQYMGSACDNEYDKWWHDFRHRACPPDGKRRYVRVPATLGYKPEHAEIFDL